MRSRVNPLLVFAVLCFNGCAPVEGEPVDYGPPVPLNTVLQTLAQGVEGIDPSATQKGAAVQYVTTQSLGGGQIVNLISATVLTVVEREEIAPTTKAPPSVALTVIEAKIALGQSPGEKNQESSREFRLVFEKGSALNSYAVEGTDAPLALSRPQMGTLSATDVTYHRLHTNLTQAAPPQPVTEKANCRGVPGCSMTYKSVSFDQVAWRSRGPEKIHFDLVVSPQVPQISGFNMSPLLPYYQGLMKSCITLLVGVGEANDEVLVTECQQVRDFRYKLDAN